LFTVYRTYYGPGSDENWNTLRNKAKEEADKELMACVIGGDEEVAEMLKLLFRLDARSDPALLDGLSLADLCKVYKDKSSPLVLGIYKGALSNMHRNPARS
jgi:hypothetical protein